MPQTPAHPVVFTFANDGQVPNSALPLLVYRQALAVDAQDPAGIVETVFEENGWTGAWRNGIFDYQHFHSTAHEALGVAMGTVTVRFGGEAGKDLAMGPGDVAVLPAGLGHRCLSASDDFLVVGAYPPGQTLDIIRADKAVEAEVLARIAALPLPECDPVTGPAGGLLQFWLGPR